MAKQIISYNIYSILELHHTIPEVSIAISRGKCEYRSRLAQKLSDFKFSKFASSQTFWFCKNDFIMGKNYQLLHLYWSIISWNVASKLKQTISTVSLLQNLLPLLTWLSKICFNHQAFLILLHWGSYNKNCQYS